MPDDEWTDESVLRGCIDGDERAIRAFVRLYSGIINAAVTRVFPGGSDAANDCAQEIIIKILSPARLKGLKNAEKFRSWLYVVAWRESLDHYRKAARLRRKTKPLDFSNADIAQISSSIFKATQDRIEARDLAQKALERLTDKRCRSFIESRYFAGFKIREIAEIMNVPEGSISPTLARNYKKLAKIISEIE